MQELIKSVEKSFQKPQTVSVKSGDTIRVHQKITEGNKERIQIFEGLLIRTKRSKSHTASITVRRIASGVGVEKSFMVHSPLVVKIEVIKRSKVRRNYLSYMRERSGKSARLAAVNFNYDSVNTIEEKTDKEADVAEVPADEAVEQKPEAKKTEDTEPKDTKSDDAETAKDAPKAKADKS